MKSSKERWRASFWWTLVMGALVALAFNGTASASKGAKEMRIGHVCVAGLAVPVARSGNDPSYREGGGAGEVERCRLPAVPAGMPGEHMLSAASVDGRSGVVMARIGEEPVKALEMAREWLAGEGWEERVASTELRRRDSGAPLSVFEGSGGRLYVAAMDDPAKGGSVIVLAGGSRGEVGR